MFSQYFGQYLLGKGIITPEKLKDAMDFQRSVHVKLGILAMNSGYMNSKQVEEVHGLQSKMDKKFGEIAIDKGYLTSEQLEGLLTSQKQAYLLLGQALMDRGYMTLEQIENALIEYKKEYSLTDIQLKAIQNGDVDEIVRTFVDLGDVKNIDIYRKYIALFVRNIIRFIEDDIRIEGFHPEGKYISRIMACQKIDGEINLLTCMDCDEEMFLKLASRYAGEEIEEIDELACASVGEFLNLHNGIFLVNMSNQGVELEMQPQEVFENKNLANMDEMCGVTFFLPNGKFNLIIGK